MRATPAIAPLALMVGLLSTGTALAQLQIGDQIYTENELGLVVEHCDKLRAVAMAPNAASTSSVHTVEELFGTAFGGEPIHPGSIVDFDLITLQQCHESGLD
jgi:hypothetical protein